MKSDFSIFMSQLRETNVDLSFFTDFIKVEKNTSAIEIHLNNLNYLLGKSDLDGAIDILHAQNPKCFQALIILIAVRRSQNKKTINKTGDCVLVQSYFDSLEGIKKYINETGLWDIFQNHKIKNLVDYVFGVEVGLDSHARKNRGGTYMEATVAAYFENNNIPFADEISSKDMPALSSLGADIKRFDFVVESKGTVFLIETNFYSSGGSKLNETARSYTDINSKISKIQGHEFVWITDGLGWKSAKNKLEGAYNSIPRLYNLTTLSDFISEVE